MGLLLWMPPRWPTVLIAHMSRMDSFPRRHSVSLLGLQPWWVYYWYKYPKYRYNLKFNYSDRLASFCPTTRSLVPLELEIQQIPGTLKHTTSTRNFLSKDLPTRRYIGISWNFLMSGTQWYSLRLNSKLYLIHRLYLPMMRGPSRSQDSQLVQPTRKIQTLLMYLGCFPLRPQMIPSLTLRRSPLPATMII